MPISAIDNTNLNHKTCVVPMAKGAVVGAVVGFATKYAYPLIKEEKNTNEYISVMKDIKKRQNTYSPWTQSYINDIKNKDVTSQAEDVFVKTYEGMEVGEKVSQSKIRKALKEIETQKPDEKTELIKLFKKAKLQAEIVAKKHIEIYNLATKHIRPTGFFVGAGAVAGAAVALVNNVLKTETK